MKSLEQKFKVLKGLTEKKPPTAGHHLRFQRKLERHNRPALLLTTWLSIAASIVLLLSLTTSRLPAIPKASDSLTLAYEAQIQSQLNYLEVNYQATFATPLQDIKLQLNDLDQAYQKLATKFNEQNQHPLLLKAMIDNLQHRLDLLNELELVLEAQNENNYEKSIL